MLTTLAVACLAHAAPPALAFDLQGHRGARGLAPENTLAAFERAMAIGVTTLELDIGITADGVPVVIHDVALNPAVARDGSGRWIASAPLVRSLTLAQLKRYDVGRLDPASSYARPFQAQQARDGARIPTLAALFARVRELGADHLRFNIEAKVDPRRPHDTLAPDAFVDRLLAVIRDAGMTDRVTLQSFDWRTLRAARRIEPAIATSCLTTRGSDADVRDGAGTWTAGLRLSDYGTVPALVKAGGCGTWSPNFRHLDQAAVQEAHGFGLKVVPWTVNRREDMARLIDWDVDGLITDYPDRLREVMGERKMALPPAVR
jgi:glycerophosphoryl diester phosphodiesterase